MSLPTPPDPAFDPLWLEELAGLVRELSHRTPRLVDLYLERRLEARISREHDGTVGTEVRTEGLAARWLSGAGTVIAARSGVTHSVVREVLGRAFRRLGVPQQRGLPPAELDPPLPWRGWATRTLEGTTRQLGIWLLSRRAVVVNAGGWHEVRSPDLLRVRLEGAAPAALLAVWGHPRLNGWMEELLAPPPPKPWAPSSGTRLPVILTSGSAGALVHELAGHLLESDLVTTGISPMGNLEGATVAPETLTILDDPTAGDLPGSFSCDDEGVAARPVTLVDGGVLRSWICDSEGARVLGAPAGRGRRATWQHPPASRMSNLVVAPGVTDPEAMERDLSHGLVVTRAGGATVDPATGTFVLRVERGWEVRGGRRRRPLAPVHLVGSGLGVLASIDPALGNDACPDWRLGWCVKDGLALPTGTLTPTLRLTGVEVL